MVAVLTVTPDPTNVPPRQLLFVTGSPGATVAITRQDPDGQVRPVRSAENAVLVGGAWSGYDYESPFFTGGGLLPGTGLFPGLTVFPSGIALTYSCQPSDGSTPFVTGTAALPVTQSWLLHPGVPSLSVPINFVTASATTAATGTTLHTILGRESPIPVSDGRKKAKTLTLSCRTADDASTAALEAELAGEVPLLLQVVYPFTSARLYLWIAVGQVVEDRFTQQFGDGRRVFTMDCTVVDRPAGGVAAQRTWADLMAECATWNSVLATYKTWEGALTGVAGT